MEKSLKRNIYYLGSWNNSCIDFFQYIDIGEKGKQFFFPASLHADARAEEILRHSLTMRVYNWKNFERYVGKYTIYKSF